MHRTHRAPLGKGSRRERRGSYVVLMSSLIVALLGFAALVLDWGRVRIAGAEAQAIADAAAEAAVMALKQEGTEQAARAAAELVVSQNTIAGMEPALLSFDQGSWDNVSRVWSTNGTNAVRVTVGRAGTEPIGLFLASLFGFDVAEVSRSATAATQRLQVVLVMDITGSWDKDNFYHARTAAVQFLDMLHNAHGSEDLVGMTVFLQRFGWEFTPMTLVSQSAASSSLVRSKWAALNVGSYAGVYQASYESQTSKYVSCRVYGTNNTGGSPWSGWCTTGSSCYQASKRDIFTSPSGGCFPNMPRYYSDEGGTDHQTGMQMARTMFLEHPDPFAYRAMIVMTDGIPNSYGSTSGSKRASQSYNEARFREYKYTGSRSVSQIETGTQSLADTMYNTDDVNIWFISFVESASFMTASSKGDGYFTVTPDATQLESIFRRIARSLPVTVVE